MARKRNFYIPKIIHQIWIGPKPRPVQWMDSWKNKHPDWEYKLWTEENLPKLRNQKQYDKINTYEGKADILRYEILYDQGGIYIDADCNCINPLDDYLRQYHFFVAYDNEYFFPGFLSNGVIGSEPKNFILEELIKEIFQIENINSEPAWLKVGPRLLTKIVKQYELFNAPIKKLPSFKFYPIQHTGWEYKGRGKVYASHHWNSIVNKGILTSVNFEYTPKSKKNKSKI